MTTLQLNPAFIPNALELRVYPNAQVYTRDETRTRMTLACRGILSPAEHAASHPQKARSREENCATRHGSPAVASYRLPSNPALIPDAAAHRSRRRQLLNVARVRR